jgi:hypothetical protein
MKRLALITRKWWFFAILLLAQFVLLPYASRNFSMDQIGNIISTTLGNALQPHIGRYNLYFQILSLLMLILLIVFRNRMKRVFTVYVAVSMLAFAFIQNIAVTETYGLSIVTVNVVMMLLVACVWIAEVFQGKNDYSFAGFRWKYSWMIPLAIFAYLCPVSAMGGFAFSPLHFFEMNSATAFCLTVPLFLTILTLNIPRINIAAYRITAIVGTVIALYNMLNFLNPYRVNVGILHIPLLVISLYCWISSYQVENKSNRKIRP